MADYQPVDISKWCNAGVEALGGDGEVAIGAQSFRGLPFLIRVRARRQRPKLLCLSERGFGGGHHSVR